MKDGNLARQELVRAVPLSTAAQSQAGDLSA
jgi:hypothetical protein